MIKEATHRQRLSTILTHITPFLVRASFPAHFLSPFFLSPLSLGKSPFYALYRSCAHALRAFPAIFSPWRHFSKSRSSLVLPTLIAISDVRLPLSRLFSRLLHFLREAIKNDNSARLFRVRTLRKLKTAAEIRAANRRLYPFHPICIKLGSSHWEIERVSSHRSIAEATAIVGPPARLRPEPPLRRHFCRGLLQSQLQNLANILLQFTSYDLLLIIICY